MKDICYCKCQTCAYMYHRKNKMMLIFSYYNGYKTFTWFQKYVRKYSPGYYIIQRDEFMCVLTN